MSEDWVATPKIRWVRPADTSAGPDRLQQWFAPDAPAYMRGSEGEWRDVEVVIV